MPLPWEIKKNMTIVTFAESAAAGSKSQALGPSTLRKLTVPISSLMMAEYAKGYSDGNNMVETQQVGTGQGFTDQPVSDSLGMSSSFAPIRPESYSANNNPLTSFTSHESNIANIDPLISMNAYNSNAQALDFINRNTILSSIDSNKTHDDKRSGLKNLLHKVHDTASTTSSHMRESASHVLSSVKHAVHIDDAHSKIHFPTNPFASTGQSSSVQTSRDMDRDTATKIFTSPQTR